MSSCECGRVGSLRRVAYWQSSHGSNTLGCVDGDKQEMKRNVWMSSLGCHRAREVNDGAAEVNEGRRTGALMRQLEQRSGKEQKTEEKGKKERKKEEEEGSGSWINSRALAAVLDRRNDLDSGLESETEWECRRRQMELVKSLSTPLYQLWPRGDTMAERSHVASINKTNWWDSPAH